MLEVKVIGAGLAGCEAAWQLAERGIHVTLTEMKPQKMTPAHHCADFAELVCSNSLRGDRLENAVGLLKEELRRLHSLILTCAEANRVEAGGALAVDRYGFSGMVTEKIKSHPNITVVEAEETEVPAGPVIIATGPLTSDAMSAAIQRYFGGQEYMSFFDAAAPLVTFSSIDMDKAWFASRYDRGVTQIMSTVQWIRMNTLPLSTRSARRRKRRCTALRTSTYSRAVCPSRSWPGAASTPCATAR